MPACRGVLTFEPHPREFFAPNRHRPRLSTLREKLELLADDGVDLAYVCRFNARFAALRPKSSSNAYWSAPARTAPDRRRRLPLRCRASRRLRAAARGRRHFGFQVDAMGASRSTANAPRVRRFATRSQAGRMEHAARLLGRPYSIDGRVVHGDKIGRQLGLPPPTSASSTTAAAAPASSPSKSGACRAARTGAPPTSATARAPIRCVRPLLEVHLLRLLRRHLRRPSQRPLPAQVARRNEIPGLRRPEGADCQRRCRIRESVFPVVRTAMADYKKP
jgi:riboflavin kinase/FMN adenylyltransferase